MVDKKLLTGSSLNIVHFCYRPLWHRPSLHSVENLAKINIEIISKNNISIDLKVWNFIQCNIKFFRICLRPEKRYWEEFLVIRYRVMRIQCEYTLTQCVGGAKEIKIERVTLIISSWFIMNNLWNSAWVIMSFFKLRALYQYIVSKNHRHNSCSIKNSSLCASNFELTW